MTSREKYDDKVYVIGNFESVIEVAKVYNTKVIELYSNTTSLNVFDEEINKLKGRLQSQVPYELNQVDSCY